VPTARLPLPTADSPILSPRHSIDRVAREAAEYPNTWMDEMGLDRAAIRPTKQNGPHDFQGSKHVVQLNGLPKIE
jgi:hypothetical protein